MKKTCLRCDVEQILESFPADGSRKDGRHPYCKGCRSAEKKAAYIRDRNKILEKASLYRANNLEAIKTRNKNYYWRDPEQRRAKNRIYTARNAEANRLRAAEWYKNNRERGLLTSRVGLAKRRSLLAAAEGRCTAKNLLAILEQQEHKCKYCDTQLDAGWHADHVLPLSRGGTNWPDNIVITCPWCNLSKHDALLPEWLDRLLLGDQPIPSNLSRLVLGLG